MELSKCCPVARDGSGDPPQNISLNMKPAPFTYHRPQTIDAVCELLADLEDAELMAGNQSLGIVMANRLATPDHLIDLSFVEDLAFIEVNDDHVEIGSMTTHRTIEQSERLVEALPILPDAAEQIAGPSVRNRGTLGGSIAEADPAGNYPAALVALDATIHLRSTTETRAVPAREFFIAYMFTDMAEEELIERVSIPTKAFPPERTGMVFEELKRAAQTFPTISAGVIVRVDDPDGENPIVEEARVTLANAADIPLHLPDAEKAIEGGPLSEVALDAAAESAYEEARPEDELHADAEYKREIAAEYTRRAIESAYERAQGVGTQE